VAEEKKSLSVTLVVAMIVVGLILAGGVSYFIATKIVADKKDAKQVREPGVFMKLGDAKDGLIVNLGGVNNGRFLKIGVILEMKPNKKVQESGGKSNSPEEIKALDTVVYVLRSQKPDDFDPAKQDKLKDLIKTEVNKAFGEDLVYDVYITNLVLQ
jgi:flagellar FliL protein